jgi:hypothetical protein
MTGQRGRLPHGREHQLEWPNKKTFIFARGGVR